MGIKKIDKPQLIKIAGDLFRSRGYCNTSMADIAKACNINKASLYHHYPSKKDLTIAVLRDLHDFFKKHFFDAVYVETISAQERLIQFTKGIEDFFKERESGCLMANLALEVGDTIPEFAAVLKAYFSDWINAIAHLLKNRYPLEQAKSIATDAVSQIQGAILLSNLYNDNSPIIRQGLNLLNMFQNGKIGSKAAAAVIA